MRQDMNKDIGLWRNECTILKPRVKTFRQEYVEEVYFISKIIYTYIKAGCLRKFLSLDETKVS